MFTKAAYAAFFIVLASIDSNKLNPAAITADNAQNTGIGESSGSIPFRGDYTSYDDTYTTETGGTGIFPGGWSS